MEKKQNKCIQKLNIDEFYDAVLNMQNENSKTAPIDTNIYEVDEINESGSRCYRIVPRENFNGTYIIYIYGSGSYRRMSLEQWKFIMHVAYCTDVGLFIPMYPLAPENDCKDACDMLIKAYKKFSIGVDVKKIILMGDSFGACLALGLTLNAWKEGLRQADQLIMLSPIIDTVFYDKELEARVITDSVFEENYFYNDTLKRFLNDYWIKDSTAESEYIAPFYLDPADGSKNLVIFSGDDDMFGCYANEYYNKAKQVGVNARLFKFKGEKHNFLIHSKTDEAKKGFGYLIDVINNTYNNSMFEIYPIKLIADYSIHYPDWISAPWAIKFVNSNHFDFSDIDNRLTEYNKILLATTYAACDAKVKEFIMKYPNSTIINLGCRLDNMFERVDNGRIQWYSIGTHNIMSVRRAMYKEREREKTIGRSLMDFSWMDEIKLDRNKGVMFVCNDSMTYMSHNQVKSILNLLEVKFPGAEFVFTVSTIGTMKLSNLFYKKHNVLKRERRQFALGDAQIAMLSWSNEFVLKSEEPIMKYVAKDIKMNIISRIKKKYNLITNNYKIIHMQLGHEKYEINV